MGLTLVPAATVVVPQQNQVVFTSSTTWTVPSTAQYVDVMVVGGGQGGTGGTRSLNNSLAGSYGGAVVIMKDIYLGGTGTVSIVVGAGSSGTAGVTSGPTTAGAGGYSGFGTYVYSAGANSTQTAAQPGYKGSLTGGWSYYPTYESNLANFAPMFQTFTTAAGLNLAGNSNIQTIAFSGNAVGLFGGTPGTFSTATTTRQFSGMHPGTGDPSANAVVTTMPIPFSAMGNLSGIGTASAGTAGAGGGAGGAAGVTGVGGGGGTCVPTAGQPGGQGGAGAGGGGSWPNPVGGTGGNGGNAGTNTGAGGGAGANTGSASAGTGGNGGNGGAGLVLVRWIG